MAKGINPSDIMTPFTNAYHHGVEVPAGGRAEIPNLDKFRCIY